jgi:Ca-activated chloride channel family protein
MTNGKTMNETKFSPDDPRLTAYALGELEGDERAVVETALQTDAAARAVVAEIRNIARQLEAALASEPMPKIKLIAAPSAQRAAIIPGRDPRKLDGGPLGNLIKFPQAYYVVAGLAAACFAVMLTLHESEVVRLEEQRKAMIAAKNEAEQKAMSDLVQRESVAKAAEAKPTFYDEVTFPAPSIPTGKIELQPKAPEMAEADKKTVVAGSIAPDQPAREKETIQLPSFSVAAASGARYGATENSVDAAIVDKERRDLSFKISGGPGKYLADFAPVPPTTLPVANTEAYAYHADSDFLAVVQNPLSTFALDVDTASYANVRRFLQAGEMPPVDAVRIEELVNYFPYDYAVPSDAAPLAATLEVAAAPWAPTHRLVRIGLRAREVTAAARPTANLVFLIDVSGSMDEPDKLPLLQQSLRLLLDQLRPDDRVAIVTYAGESSLALPSLPASHRREILDVLNALHAEGSTNGGRGLELAYDIAKANFIAGGTNRVILSTDGDFNIGVTSEGELARLVEEKARSGVALTALGFGTGNYQDALFKQLAEKGHGNYGYINTLDEAKKLLVEQVGGTLVTAAKDVKVQVEFNPAQVQSYRLIGYDDRALKKEDFNNDAITAGDVGAGHTVTALYEIVPAGVEPPATPGVDALKYRLTETGRQKPPSFAEASAVAKAMADKPAGEQKSGNLKSEIPSPELLTVKVRYTPSEGGASRRLEFPLTDHGAAFAEASLDFKFAAAVAGFGMILRDSPEKGSATLAAVEQWAGQGLGTDAGGYRAEFIGLVHQAEKLKE